MLMNRSLVGIKTRSSLGGLATRAGISGRTKARKKEVHQTVFGSSASGKQSSTITGASILAIQVLDYLKEFRPISSIITRKNIKALG
jgi:hypothetical protein